jgi:hypothetical protein
MNLVALCADIMTAIGQIGHAIWLKSGDAIALQVNKKSAGDVSTQMDCWAETELKTILLQALPGAHFAKPMPCCGFSADAARTAQNTGLGEMSVSR